MNSNRRKLLATLGGHCLAPLAAAQGQKRYGPGVTDSKIKIGQTMPYSGPLSVFGTVGRAEAAYFQMINDQGGVNGRQIKLLSLDDGFSPPKTVEQTRKLVEQDNVLLMFGSLGTPTNIAVQKYLNLKKVPQIFVTSGATRWGDPRNFPWTMGVLATYQHEGHIYARAILANNPRARIAVLMQNDDLGRDYLKGLRDGLGAKADQMIVGQATYEPHDPTVDSQIITLQATGADVFVNFSTPKEAAQAIRKAASIGWRPMQFLAVVSMSIETVLKPAGLENCKGIISSNYLRDITDTSQHDTPEMKEYFRWLKQYFPDGNPKPAEPEPNKV